MALIVNRLRLRPLREPDFILSSYSTLAPQNLLHLPPLRQLIHQLIQIPDLLCQSVFDFFNTVAAYYSRDEVSIWV